MFYWRFAAMIATSTIAMYGRAGIRLVLDGRSICEFAASKSEANLLFEVGKRLKVGYQGYYSCAGEPAAPAAG